MDIVQELKLFEIDHDPEGWPAIRMRQISAVCDELTALRAENERLKAELAESDALRDKLAKLLAETAVALKGEEEALTRHSWHDLPVIALAVVIELAESKAELAKCREDAERLDFLDSMNMRKNAQNGTVYGWKLEENCNAIRLTDHNIPPLKVRSAIDAARKGEA